MPNRIWTLVSVATDVNCSSSGHHFFSAHFRVKGQRRRVLYCLDGNTIPERLPKYVVQAIEDTIGYGGPEHFRVFEYDRDRNERYTDLRYHDAEYFAKRVRDLYPLPF